MAVALATSWTDTAGSSSGSAPSATRPGWKGAASSGDSSSSDCARHGPPHLMRLLRVQLSPGRVELALEFPRCGGRYTHINHGQRSLEFYVGGRRIFFLLRVRRMTGSYTQLQKSGRNHVLADFENVGKIANKDDVGVGERVGAERTLDLFESAGDEKER